MGRDTADLVAYGFYVWVVIAGLSLLVWIVRRRIAERSRPDPQPVRVPRPEPPLLDLEGHSPASPPQPPRPPWLANVDRFTEEPIGTDPEPESIRIDPEDVASALEGDLDVSPEIDDELTSEIAPALRSDVPVATNAGGDAEIDVTEVIDLTDGLGADDLTADSEAESVTAAGGSTRERDDKPPDDLYWALTGIRLPAGLIPETSDGGLDADGSFIFRTTSASMRLASSALAAELERLGYALRPVGVNEWLGSRARTLDSGEEVSDLIVVSTPPVPSGEPVRIGVALAGKGAVRPEVTAKRRD